MANRSSANKRGERPLPTTIQLHKKDYVGGRASIDPTSTGAFACVAVHAPVRQRSDLVVLGFVILGPRYGDINDICLPCQYLGGRFKVEMAQTAVVILAALDVGSTFCFSEKGTAVPLQLLAKCEDSAGGTVR